MLFPVIMWSWLHAMWDANEASQKEGERERAQKMNACSLPTKSTPAVIFRHYLKRRAAALSFHLRALIQHQFTTARLKNSDFSLHSTHQLTGTGVHKTGAYPAGLRNFSLKDQTSISGHRLHQSKKSALQDGWNERNSGCLDMDASTPEAL